MNRKNKKRVNRNPRNYQISHFICVECGHDFPLPRNRKQRKYGHIKDIYCPYCGEVKHFMEIRVMECFRNAAGEVIFPEFGKSKKHLLDDIITGNVNAKSEQEHTECIV